MFAMHAKKLIGSLIHFLRNFKLGYIIMNGALGLFTTYFFGSQSHGQYYSRLHFALHCPTV